MLDDDLSTGTVGPRSDRRSPPVDAERPGIERPDDGGRDARSRRDGTRDAPRRDRRESGPDRHAFRRGQRASKPGEQASMPDQRASLPADSPSRVESAAGPGECASRRELREEIERLDQELRSYETREQEVIDRYERLLREQRRREREEDARSKRSERGTLTRLKYRVLRTLGLR